MARFAINEFDLNNSCCHLHISESYRACVTVHELLKHIHQRQTISVTRNTPRGGYKKINKKTVFCRRSPIDLHHRRGLYHRSLGHL